MFFLVLWYFSLLSWYLPKFSCLSFSFRHWISFLFVSVWFDNPFVFIFIFVDFFCFPLLDVPSVPLLLNIFHRQVLPSIVTIYEFVFDRLPIITFFYEFCHAVFIIVLTYHVSKSYVFVLMEHPSYKQHHFVKKEEKKNFILITKLATIIYFQKTNLK